MMDQCDSPVITDGTAPPPLNGTCSDSNRPMFCSSAPARWLCEPLPEEDMLSAPFFARASSIRSTTDFTPSDALTISTLGVMPMVLM